MLFEEINENFPKYSVLGKYTSIEVEQTSDILEVVDKLQMRFYKNIEFIPPLFSEYVVRLILLKEEQLAEIREAIRIKYPDMSPKQQEEAAQRILKGDTDKLAQTFLIRWADELTFTILIYMNGMKTLYIKVRYEYTDEGLTHLNMNCQIISAKFQAEKYNRGEEWFRSFCQRQVFFIMALADYMLNYTDKVEYERILYTPNKSSQNSNKVKRQNGNKSRNIVLKSRIKKYIISNEDAQSCKKRNYRKITNSWFVRGYYQHFGADKHIKYIPPRINHRKDCEDAPDPKKYIIKP